MLACSAGSTMNGDLYEWCITHIFAQVEHGAGGLVVGHGALLWGDSGHKHCGGEVFGRPWCTADGVWWAYVTARAMTYHKL